MEVSQIIEDTEILKEEIESLNGMKQRFADIIDDNLLHNEIKKQIEPAHEIYK